MKAMIIEDDIVCASLLEQLLLPHGSVQKAETGELAIQLFEEALKKQEPFDLICLDIILPGIDGHEVLKQFRTLEKQYGKVTKTNVMVISARYDTESILKTYCGECYCYLTKPIYVNEFYLRLSELGYIRLPPSFQK